MLCCVFEKFKFKLKERFRDTHFGNNHVMMPKVEQCSEAKKWNVSECVGSCSASFTLQSVLAFSGTMFKKKIITILQVFVYIRENNN